MKTMKRTMNRIYTLALAATVMLTAVSCRQDSDELLPYGYRDNYLFDKAKGSFAAQFQILWNGLSQNYGIWDVEKDVYGLDWDAVYDQYLPKFEALDRQENVSDDDLRALMEDVLRPLHDGHLSADLYNYRTNNYVSVYPSKLRNVTRSDFNTTTQNVSETAYDADIIEERTGEMTADAALYSLLYGESSEWLTAQISALESKAAPTELDLFNLKSLKELRQELGKIEEMESDAEMITANNVLCMKYAFLNVPGLQLYTPQLYENNYLRVQYILFQGNIAYLRFNKFGLSPFLNREAAAEAFAQTTPGDAALIESVREAWTAWFNTIQQLKGSGRLGGVIIDLRNNGGGSLDDAQYVMGALLPAGSIEFAKCRFKRGTGRYDYSPMMPLAADTYEGEHAVVTERVAVLTNCHSISMSEMSALMAKRMPAARVIGTRTWGGVCALQGEDSYSENYASHIGVAHETPVYVYLPTCCSFTPEGKSYEGIGVEPDIEVALDEAAYTATGRDSQLDRALQYIRTGN